MIAKLNKCLDLCFNQIQQTHHQDTTSLQQHNSSSSQEQPFASQHNHEFNVPQTQQHKKHSSNNTSNQQVCDSPLTISLLNRTLKIKTTTQKYSSINYSNTKLPPVHGQKSIEILPTKPSLPTCLWKTIAVGNYIDLHEFAYTNLKTSLKNNIDEQTLQASEGGIIAICKRNQQELNAYHNHINTLCIRQEFSAVITYDEDRRLGLTMNRDSTLLEQNIEAKDLTSPGTTAGKSALTRIVEGVLTITTANGFMPV
ncbi:5035_t:CDS:2 [Cetraspora pellucida]|uniref:5035_t:CDS:1 n=1 Tax=Cetraspora pellucida TaxID=1433469 RepID=A0A9N9DXQ8_9GLOM|nr:5035_t:CDS:2 [Cetraspora pellucida]